MLIFSLVSFPFHYAHWLEKSTHSDIRKFLIFLKEWLLNVMIFFDRIRNRFSSHSFFHILFLLIHPHFLVYIYNSLCVCNILCTYMVYNAASQHKSFFALWPPPCPTALCEPHNCSQAGIWAPRTSGRIPSLWVLDSASCDAKAFAFTTGSRFRVFLDGSCNCRFKVCIIKQNVLQVHGTLESWKDWKTFALVWPTENKPPKTQRVVISPVVCWKGHGMGEKP